MQFIKSSHPPPTHQQVRSLNILTSLLTERRYQQTKLIGQFRKPYETILLTIMVGYNWLNKGKKIGSHNIKIKKKKIIFHRKQFFAFVNGGRYSSRKSPTECLDLNVLNGKLHHETLNILINWAA